jgi:hypothetical protein
MGKLAIGEGRPYVDLNVDAQAKALRLRMYVLRSECARLIDMLRAIGHGAMSKPWTLSATQPKNTGLAGSAGHTPVEP